MLKSALCFTSHYAAKMNIAVSSAIDYKSQNSLRAIIGRQATLACRRYRYNEARVA